MKESLLFLGRFVLVAGVLYGLWQGLSPFYLGLVVPVVNGFFVALDLPVELQRFGQSLLLVYERSSGSVFRLEARSYEAVYLNIIAATALLAATPHKSINWKLRWIGGVLLLLWGTHVASFFIGAHIAIWNYIYSIPPSQSQGELMLEFRLHFPFSHKEWYTSILAQWNIWGRYSIVIGTWFFALRREIVDWALGVSTKQVAVPMERVSQWRHKSLRKKVVMPKNKKMSRLGKAPHF